MARVSKPWYRASKKTWYVKVEGKMQSLGVQGLDNEAEAVKAWHKAMAGVREKAKPKPKPEPTVQEVLSAFLADVEGRVVPETLRTYTRFLQAFSQKHGKGKASGLSPHVAEAYARGHAAWTDNTRNACLGTLATAFKWAERARLIDGTPLVGLKRPPKSSRGAVAVIGPADNERLLAAAGKHFEPFLRLLHLTGARPGEVSAIDADNFNEEQGVVVLKAHKEKHKGKSRTIYLCPEAVALLKEQKAKHGEGRLLRNALGGAWKPGSLGAAMRAVRLRAGVKGAFCYGYRHSFATDALAHGVPDAQVAALLGHSGTTMLHKHYSHLTGQARTLKEALGKVR